MINEFCLNEDQKNVLSKLSNDDDFLISNSFCNFDIYFEDRNFCIHAICENRFIFQYLDEIFKCDKQFTLDALRFSRGDCLSQIDEVFYKDFDIYNAVSAIGNVDMSYFGDENLNLHQKTINYIELQKSMISKFNDDKAYVLDNIGIDGMLLELVSIRLKNDKEVVLVAVKQNPDAVQWVGDDLKHCIDKDINKTIDNLKIYKSVNEIEMKQEKFKRVVKI